LLAESSVDDQQQCGEEHFDVVAKGQWSPYTVIGSAVGGLTTVAGQIVLVLETLII